MKITSLTVGGFKGIKNKATTPLAPITLFFGANSTGKSTVLHALLYLYETRSSK
ncbi:ATP-binding protein [Vibrio vulnificus]|nr:ATP-binding protein [Vibrio vulnificus]